jgi:hypothetical protein
VRADLDQSAILKPGDALRVKPQGIGIAGGGSRFRCDPGKYVPAFFRTQTTENLPDFPIDLQTSGCGTPAWCIRITRSGRWGFKLQLMRLTLRRKGNQTVFEFSVEDQTLQFVPPEGIPLPCDYKQCGRYVVCIEQRFRTGEVIRIPVIEGNDDRSSRYTPTVEQSQELGEPQRIAAFSQYMQVLFEVPW